MHRFSFLPPRSFPAHLRFHCFTLRSGPPCLQVSRYSRAFVAIVSPPFPSIETFVLPIEMFPPFLDISVRWFRWHRMTRTDPRDHLSSTRPSRLPSRTSPRAVASLFRIVETLKTDWTSTDLANDDARSLEDVARRDRTAIGCSGIHEDQFHGVRELDERGVVLFEVFRTGQRLIQRLWKEGNGTDASLTRTVVWA